jgi:flagellar protein FlbD
MIQLTRLNNKPLGVNSDLIKFVEQAPDTLITLITGEKIVVRESAEDVVARIVEFRRSVLGDIFWGMDSSSRQAAALHSARRLNSGADRQEPEG